jgi:hypothetical protein
VESTQRAVDSTQRAVEDLRFAVGHDEQIGRVAGLINQLAEVV